MAQKDQKTMTRKEFLKKGGVLLAGIMAAGPFGLDYLSSQEPPQQKMVLQKDSSDLVKLLQHIKTRLPNIDPNFNNKAYAHAIISALQSHNLSYKKNGGLTELVAAITAHESGFRTRNRKAVGLPFFYEDPNDATTGPMEVHVENYANKKGIPKEEVRKSLQTVQGGIEGGIDVLMGILSTYPSISHTKGGLRGLESNLDFILSDWFAGQYASRNSAVQKRTNELLKGKRRIAVDGDMLHYKAKISRVKDEETKRKLVGKGNTVVNIEYDKNGEAYLKGFLGKEKFKVDVPRSETETAIAEVLRRSPKKVRGDLIYSRGSRFVSTLTYDTLMKGSKYVHVIPTDAQVSGGRVKKFIGELFGESTTPQSYIRSVREKYQTIKELAGGVN